MFSTRLIWLFLALGTAQAQQHEIGILGGGGWAAGLPIQGAPPSTSAGFQSGAVAGAVLSQDLYGRWSGEIRYLFQERNLRVTSGGTTASFAGQAHVLQYELMFYTRPRKQRIRPYLAVGGGMKLFRGTGTETAYRPLMEYAYLTRAQQLQPMLTAGGGVKIQLNARLRLRIDIRDQITRFPSKLIAPAPGMSLNGWLQDFVPTVGLSWSF